MPRSLISGCFASIENKVGEKKKNKEKERGRTREREKERERERERDRGRERREEGQKGDTEIVKDIIGKTRKQKS